MDIVCTLSKRPRLDLCSDAPHGWALAEGWRKDKRTGEPISPIHPTYYGTSLEAALQAAVKLLVYRRATEEPTDLRAILDSIKSIRAEVLDRTRVAHLTSP